MSAPLLTVQNLRVSFPTRTGLVEAVRGVSFTLGRERLGIVGESGSGKSQTGRAIMGLTPKNARIEADALRFGDIDLLKASAKERRIMRGKRMAMILQDPKYSLNPVMTIGRQIMETLRTHEKIGGGEARQRTLAMMLVCGPELLIADEPTSALDVTVQLEVLDILDKLVRDRGMGLIFVSHDLRLVSSFCDRVLVMYAGKVVEELASANLKEAKHPYTQGLLNCLPEIGGHRHPLPVLERKPEWRA